MNNYISSMPFVESPYKSFGTLLQDDNSNRPVSSNKLALDYEAGDFSFFKPYVFGQYGQIESKVDIESASKYVDSPVTVSAISSLDTACTILDLSYVDFEGCDPSDASFLSLWSTTDPYVDPNADNPTTSPNSTMTPNPTTNPIIKVNKKQTGSLLEDGIFNARALQQQCFKAHYCVNSVMSKSLDTMNSTSSGKVKRFEDLEDFYFREMLHIFNQFVAILVMFGIVVVKMFSKQNILNPSTNLSTKPLIKPSTKPSIPTIKPPIV
jgi:hypothetical protein